MKFLQNMNLGFQEKEKKYNDEMLKIKEENDKLVTDLKAKKNLIIN